MMTFLPTKEDDISSILEIINQAQAYLAMQNIDQWQNGYPNEKAILKDVFNNDSYVVKTKDATRLLQPCLPHKPNQLTLLLKEIGRPKIMQRTGSFIEWL